MRKTVAGLVVVAGLGSCVLDADPGQQEPSVTIVTNDGGTLSVQALADLVAAQQQAIAALQAKTQAFGAQDGADIRAKLATDCPDPSAVSTFGFCIWHDLTQDKTYQQAAAACVAQDGRLCTRAEVSAAQAAGASWCSDVWLADRVTNGGGDDTDAYHGYPRDSATAGCGNKVGVVETTSPMTSTFGVVCCRP